MTKDQTAERLIRLALENGVPTTKLQSFMKGLRDISYINSSYIDGLFRASSIVDGYTQVQSIEHEIYGRSSIID